MAKQGHVQSPRTAQAQIVLEKVRIRDYRSCLDTRIDLQPDLSVLIGPNGSGKTTVLNALMLLRSLATERPFMRRPQEAVLGPSRLTAYFRFKDKRAVLHADLYLRTDEKNSDVILSSDQSWEIKDFTGTSRRLKAPLWLARNANFGHGVQLSLLREPAYQLAEQFRNPFESISAFLSEMKYYSASQFTNPSLCPVSFEVEQEGPLRRGLRLRGHSRFLYDLYSARETPSYQEFKEVVGRTGMGLVNDIVFKEIPTSSIDYQVRSGGEIQQVTQEKILVVPQFVVGKNALSPNQLSEGTFKTITLLFYVMTEKSSALLVEEPEVCVHHGLLSSIVELIKLYSKQTQIILSTHSDFVLDKLEPRHVYTVSRTPDEGTVAKHLTKSMTSREAKALKQYLDSEGNLGEYWRYGGLQ